MTRGQAAYAAFTNVIGRSISWDGLNPIGQKAWEIAADAAVHFVPDHVDHPRTDGKVDRFDDEPKK